MRRTTLAILLAGALALGACGSDNDTVDTTSGASTTAAASGGASTTNASTPASSDFADVCAGRNLASPPAQGQQLDYAAIEKNIEAALAHAPSDIKPDLTIVLGPSREYFRILAEAKGDYLAAARNARFQQLAATFAAAEYRAAAERLRNWFLTHCR